MGRWTATCVAAGRADARPRVAAQIQWFALQWPEGGGAAACSTWCLQGVHAIGQAAGGGAHSWPTRCGGCRLADVWCGGADGWCCAHRCGCAQLLGCCPASCTTPQLRCDVVDDPRHAAGCSPPTWNITSCDRWNPPLTATQQNLNPHWTQFAAGVCCVGLLGLLSSVCRGLCSHWGGWGGIPACCSHAEPCGIPACCSHAKPAEDVLAGFDAYLGLTSGCGSAVDMMHAVALIPALERKTTTTTTQDEPAAAAQARRHVEGSGVIQSEVGL